MKGRFVPTVKMQTRSNCKALVKTLDTHPANVLLSENLNMNPDTDLNLQELKQVIVSKDPTSSTEGEIKSIASLKALIDKLFV